ncbi:hypothetical protein [Rhodococcus globerulus]|uniref:hypothetical protein n=1 Tax=Rhodococcus globerulus TaxID=33008 RepID=UPI001C5881DA|nr:hypothetical protein [Rhodococcus globerulus]QXW04046.1 hypothetical protein KYT97_08505 [Rhodococcus globerulus]
MTHAQMAPQYVAASKKQCPLTIPLAVLGDVDLPEFDALDTALAVDWSWPDEADVDRNDISVDRGELSIDGEPRIEPAPSWAAGRWGIVTGSALSAITFTSLGVLYVLREFGGWPA